MLPIIGAFKNMANNLYNTIYNPDVLSCIANLSSDEVFTPPEVANAMLDLLPQELFSDPNTTFLDPACKSGIFLREIAKRLLKGLEPIYPDLQERADHIFKKQLFGIAITELTSHLSRRSLYCSKYANGKYSVTHFDNIDGNIRYKIIQHQWQNGRCVFCGANKEQYDRGKFLETHAYETIHTTKPEDIFQMKFDVIIGNPPYQLSDGGGMGTSATPLYDKFVEQAMKLNPRFLTMIIPARWYAGGKGLDNFRNNMLHDNHLRVITDYFNAEDVFPGVDISGGVCYFLWDRDNAGDCKIISNLNGKQSVMVRPLLESNSDTFIRFNEAVSIVRKVMAFKEQSFADIVSARKPFGLEANDKIYDKYISNSLKVYAYPKNGYVNKSCVRQNSQDVGKYKVMIAKAYGERGDFPYLVIGKPFLALPGEVCTETYLAIGPNKSKEYAQNIISYMTTKLFRFFVLFKKNTQNAAKGVYDFVPMQDFTEPWSDKKLYAKYGISDEEIEFIDSMIRPMDLNVEEE